MKNTLLIALLLFSISAFSQQDSISVKQQMFENIPTKDGKIFYDTVINVGAGLTKEVIFTRIRQWFVENFTYSKAVLQIDDIKNGLLTGKGTYKYSIANGLTFHDGRMIFIINVAVKDGKFRYQIYDFSAIETRTSMLGESQYSGVESSVDLNDVNRLQQQGKRKAYCRKYLSRLIDLVYEINTTLPETVKKENISDF